MVDLPQPLEPDHHLPARLQREIDPRELTLSEEHDLETCRHLARCRALSSDLIVQLVGDPQVGDQRLRKRLCQLFRHGYLDRPQEQQVHAVKPGGRWGGAKPLVYALGRRGAQAIAGEEEFAGLDGKRFDRNNKEIKERQIAHALLISQVYATLWRACKARPDVARFHFWQQGSDLHDAFVVDSAGNLVRGRAPSPGDTRHVVYPDGFLGLLVPGLPGDRDQQLNFFLEADRDTVDLKRMALKYRAFWKFNRLGLHTANWDIQRFRVLTVTVSEGHRQSLREAARKADDHQIGSSLFLFASASAIRLDEPESIFAKIWQTPSDDTPVDLFG